MMLLNHRSIPIIQHVILNHKIDIGAVVFARNDVVDGADISVVLVEKNGVVRNMAQDFASEPREEIVLRLIDLCAHMSRDTAVILFAKACISEENAVE